MGDGGAEVAGGEGTGGRLDGRLERLTRWAAGQTGGVGDGKRGGRKAEKTAGGKHRWPGRSEAEETGGGGDGRQRRREADPGFLSPAAPHIAACWSPRLPQFAALATKSQLRELDGQLQSLASKSQLRDLDGHSSQARQPSQAQPVVYKCPFSVHLPLLPFE